MPREPGSLIANRYRVDRKLGESGGGEVYRAHDNYVNETVVVKLLNLAALPPGNPWLEAEALRQLEDEHILPIRNADFDAGQPYIVTALAEHGTVSDLVVATEGCGLYVDEVVTLIRDACHGVDRAHRAGLVHNDIKPENLFLNAQRECLVGDFGGASLIPRGASAAVPHATTPNITAPEMAAAWGTGTPTATVRSDVYSMGATAYTCLCGAMPYQFPPLANFDQRLAIVAAGAPPRLRDRAPHVPKPVATAIERAMARDPAARFESTLELARALGNRAEAPRRWTRTNPHPGHLACWKGEPRDGGSTLLMCLTQGTKPNRVTITTTHESSGRRQTDGCREEIPENGLSTAVRGIIKALR
jgi:serine/threonine-protein kinase